jgi:RHS repeat-associated protein
VLYTQQRDALKEDLLLKTVDSKRRFSFDVRARRGLRVKLLRSGALAIRDRRRRTRMTVGAPFMVDAKKQSHRVRSRLRRTAGGWRLTYVLSDRWLDSADRAWPVTVDPSTAPNPDGDCYLDASMPDSSFCSANPMKVGMVGGHDHHVVLRFPLAAIPRGVDVAGATLVTWQTSPTIPDEYDLRAEPLTESFTGAASWNRNDGVDRFSEPGGEGDPDGRTEWGGSVGGTSGREDYVTMLKTVREWVSGERPNHGLLLSQPSGGNGAWIDSTESATHKPYLNVVYSQRVGNQRGLTNDTQELTDRMSLGVNVASGNLKVEQTDFSMPGGLGPDVDIERTYNSLDDHVDAFGEWQLNTGPDYALEQNAGAKFMRLITPTGAAAVYDLRSDGSYKTPSGYDNTLRKDQPSAGRWELTDHKSQTKYRFENYLKDGRLYEVEDRNGRKLSLVYDATTERLARIEDSNNDTSTTADDVRFTFAGAHTLTSMTDPAGRSYTYGYDASGTQLLSYADPQNGTANKTLYEYNGVNGQLSKITTPQGNVTTIGYYPAGDRNVGRVKTVTRVTNTTAMTGPTRTYDYTFRRDGSGETEITDEIGTASGDENDRITRYVFDKQGRVTKVVDALGHARSQTYTANSNVESYSAASNRGTTPNTTNRYDSPDDNAIESKTPVAASGTSIKECADYGAPDSSTDRCDSPVGTYNGVPTGPTGVKGGEYLPGRSTDAQGNRTNLTWNTTGDNNGNLYGVQQTANDGTVLSSVGSEYEPTATSVDGKPGQLRKITDGRNNPTVYGYDAKGNVASVTPPNPGGLNPLGPARMVYDQSLNRLSRVQDGKDNYRVLTYDSLDRLTKVEFTGANTTLDAGEPYVQYTYDRDGNQTGETTREETSGTVRTRSMTYDALNRVTSESLPGGASTSYTYDRVGNLRSLTDGGGNTEYTYDAANRVRAVYEPGMSKPTKFTYDQDDQRTKTAYPNGVAIDQQYDTVFRVTDIWAKNGSTTLQRYSYKYADPSSSRETDAIYEKTDGVLNQTTQYRYDPLSRLRLATIKSSAGTWASNPTLAQYAYNLDPTGNVTKKSVTGSQTPNDYTDFTYNVADELCTRVTGTSTSVPTTTCPTTAGTTPRTYDKNGNETAAGSVSRATDYDLADHAVKFTLNGVASPMIYLGPGQDRKIVEGSAGLQDNVLGISSRTSGASTDYFTRDDGGALISRRNGSTRHYYLFDAMSVTGLTGSGGGVAERYDYEPYGAPAPRAAGQWAANTNAADVPQGQFGFHGGYRSIGGLYQFGQRYYDPDVQRWTQPDPLDQTGDLSEGNPYVYAAADPVNNSDEDGTAVREAGGPFFGGVGSPNTMGGGARLPGAGGGAGAGRGFGSSLGSSLRRAIGSVFSKKQSRGGPGKAPTGPKRRHRHNRADDAGKNRGGGYRKRPPGHKGPWPPKTN